MGRAPRTEPVTEVVVVGGGPVGLWLLAELRLRGVPAVLLEQATERPEHSRGIATHARTLEVLAMRGVADRLVAEGRPVPAMHFGMIPAWVDLSAIDSPFPYMLGLYQRRTEELLEEHVLAQGADLRRGHRAAEVRDAGEHAEVTVEGPDGEYVLRASFVVGCDGSGSTVRRAAGIPFEGESSTRTTFLADVLLEHPPERPISHVGRNGSFVVVPLPGGMWRMIGFDPELMAVARDVPVTLEEVRASARRILGDDHGAHSPLWTARVGNHALQAAEYRRGRLLLAGDAAHIHPPQGGQGLNLGVQDAMNLGWKLAATVQGWAPQGLLDTYGAERHPVGADVLRSTLAQNGLAFALEPEERAVRDLLTDLMRDVPAVTETLAQRISGLAVAYPPGDPDAHPLTGRRVPDLELAGGRAASVLPLLADGAFHLLDLAPAGAPAPPPALDGRVAWDVVSLVGPPEAWGLLTALLVRPDGYVAWATEEAGGARRSAGIAAALSSWCTAGGERSAPSRIPRPWRTRARQAPCSLRAPRGEPPWIPTCASRRRGLHHQRPLPVRRRPAIRAVPALLAALLVLLIAAPPSLAACPGAAGPCPYVSAGQVGQVAGVLRFPQAVAVAADGSVYVGDQTSHVVHVFNPDGSVRGVVGTPGQRTGEIMAVASVAIGADGLFVAEGRSNRVLRFGPDGGLLGSFGGPGEAVGRFRFGAGGGHDAPAGGGLALAGGHVYVSDTGNDRVQRLRPDGTHAVEVIPRGVLANPRGLAVWGGRIFVADDRNHRVAVFDIAGRLLTTMGTQGVGPAQLNFPYGVAVDPAGRVFVADDLNHRVVRFGVLPRYPYQARWGSYGTAPGQLAFPRNIATDAAGRIYVTNTGDDRVDVFDRSGALLRSFGSDGRVPGQFDAPTGIAADASGVRAVVDTTNGRLQFLGPDGTVVAVWGSPNPGPTILKHPVAVAFDGAGNAYVADDRRNRIVVFDRATGTPSRTVGEPGRLSGPSALVVAPDGTLLVADRLNDRIVRFGADGAYLGPVASVDDPRGIAIAPDGTRIYVSLGTNRIAVLGADGSPLATFGGTGTTAGKLNAPGQIALDGAGTVWVADKGNSRVQRFGADGAHLLTLGVRGTALGEFVNPSGVAIDCHGVLSVTDTLGNRVQQFALSAPPPATCAALPAPAQPPAPQRPTLPLAPGPELGLRMLRTTGLLTTRNLPLRLRCDTACGISVTAALTPRRAPRRGRIVQGRLAGSLRLAAGQSGLLRLRLSQTDARRLSRALGRSSGLLLSLYAQATDPAGETTTVDRDVLARR